MSRLTLPALALCLVMAGCAPEKSEKTGSGPVASNSQPSSAGAPDPTPSSPSASQQSPSNPETSPDGSTIDPGTEVKAPANPKKIVEPIEKALEQNKGQLLIAPKGRTGWRPATQKPELLAQQSEQKLASSKNISGIARTELELGGRRGMNISKVAIQDSKNFFVEYLQMTTKPQPSIHKEVVVGNGALYATNDLTENGWSKPRPLTALKQEEKAPMDAWAYTFPRKIFSALQGGRPFSTLIADARKAGFNVTTEEVFKQAGDRQVRQNRILITRPENQLKTKGKLDFELIIDSYRHLPVTIRVNHEPPKQEPTRVMWTMRWNLDPTQKLSKEDFKIPTSTGKAAQKLTSKL